MRITIFSSMVMMTWVFLAIVTPLLLLEPNEIHLDKILFSPSLEVWFGYDHLGRFVFDRCLEGAKTSFYVAFLVVFMSCIIGTMVGLLSGYIGGVVDHIVVRFMDILLAFPGVLLAIALAGIMGPGLDNLVLALICMGWVGFARLTRAQVLSLKERDHVTAAIALGTPTIRILRRHLLPLTMTPLIVEATYGLASVIVAEAGMSYLGLGAQPPQSSWGNLLKEGTNYMFIAPHMVLIPGFFLVNIVFAVNWLGDRFRDRIQKKQW